MHAEGLLCDASACLVFWVLLIVRKLLHLLIVVTSFVIIQLLIIEKRRAPATYVRLRSLI